MGWRPRVALAVALAALIVAAAPATAGVVVTRIEMGSNPSISRDGSVVALESGRDLDPADENGDGIGDNDQGGLWLWHRIAGNFERVAAVGSSVFGEDPELSADGQTVGLTARFNFGGEPVTEVSGGVYVRDIPGGATAEATTLVSRDYERAVERRPMAISDDGQFIAWEVPDVALGTHTLYYANTMGGPPVIVAEDGFDPDLSGDGRLIAYTRELPDRTYAVFVKDMVTGKVERVSRDTKNRAGSGYGPSISANGRFVAFRSLEELVPRAERWEHVYVRDRARGKTKLVSTTATGQVAKGSGPPVSTPFRAVGTSISANGLFVAFKTNAPLDPRDGKKSIDLYVKDRASGLVTRVPLRAKRTDDAAFDLSADDGRYLVFERFASDTTIDVMLADLTAIRDAPLCNGKPATIVGTALDDDLVGTSGADVIAALAGNDLVDGGGGDDTICLGAGDDEAQGGTGDDRIDGEQGDDTLSGGTGSDLLLGAGGNDRLNGGAGGDRMLGEAGNDRLNGNRGNDTMSGGGGEDVMFGGVGRDIMLGGRGRDSLFGGFGNDNMSGHGAHDGMFGGPGNDRMQGGPGNDRLEGATGNDCLDGGPAGPILGPSANVVDGGPGRRDRARTRPGIRIIRVEIRTRGPLTCLRR